MYAFVQPPKTESFLKAKPSLFEIRSTCVSTAIAGTLNPSDITTFAVLRPTPGNVCKVHDHKEPDHQNHQ